MKAANRTCEHEFMLGLGASLRTRKWQ